MTLPKTSLLILTIWACSWEAQANNPQAEWWYLLEEASNPAVQTRWGLKYENAQGVSRDYARAAILYCAAARRGHASAQIRLGWMYANGNGVPQDRDLAAAWLQLAAIQGDKHAKRLLALLTSDSTEAKSPRCISVDGTELDVRMTKAESGKRRQVEKWVYRLAPDYGLDAQLVLAVIQAESNFNPNARSLKNAQGLMQLIPATGARFGVRDLMHPVQNLQGGMAYLRWLLALFQGDVRLALAAYNAGERAVEKYRGVPPYPETMAYVAKIIRNYGRTRHPPVAKVVEPSAILAAAFSEDQE